MKKEAKLFIAFTPLNLLIASAAARLSQDNNFLIWVGPKNKEWKRLIDGQPVWKGVFDFSGYRVLNFWDYLRTYNYRFKHLRKLLTEDLADYNINEISTGNDKNFFFLLVMKAYGKNAWAKATHYDDGVGVYLSTKERSWIRFMIKLLIDTLLMRRTLPWNFGVFSGNPLIRKIYTVCPELVPCKTGKEIIDISDQFRRVLFASSEKIQGISPLPDSSGIILSENLSRAKIMSLKEEAGLVEKMVTFLRKECRVKKVYVKYHHFDRSSQKEIFNSLGVEEITTPNLPYEILHLKLKPEYVVSVCSSALFYCSLLEYSGKLIAFCGEKRWQRLSEFFSKTGILVI